MRLYFDTSAFGGYYDPEFSHWTRKLLNQLIYSDSQRLVYSALTARELRRAPERVSKLIDKVPQEKVEFIMTNQAVIDLATAYIKAGALTKKFEEDAEHIALASVYGVDVLVSWNFKHMVNLIRLKQYNSINLRYGYSQIDIRNPRELLL